MVIPRRSREEFLGRPRIDFRQYKNFGNDRIEQIKLGLPAEPPIYYKLTPLQRTCFVIGATRKRFSFFNATGTGKALLSIALIRYFRKLGIIKSALILVPNRLNKYEFAKELAKHSPTSSFLLLDGSTADKWRLLEKDRSLFVIETYSGLSRLVCPKRYVIKKGKNTGDKELAPDAGLIKKLCERFGGLVCDESQYTGSHTKLPFRICRQIAKKAEVVFALTATPFNRDPTLLWAQMFLVDGGETLGETLGLFRSVFCKEKVNFFSGRTEYTFDKKKQDLLHKFIANKSIDFESAKGTLPECTYTKEVVRMPEEAQAYYRKFRDALVAARGNYQEGKNAFIRLRQISSGFVGFTDDETGEKAKFAFPDNPKLDMLLSILRGTKEGEKNIIFFDFTWSGERLLEALKKSGRGAVLLYGKTKNVDAVRQQFMDDPRVQDLVLQNKFGVGLNIQIARSGIFYESPISAIVRKQCRGRFVRQHALHKRVNEIDLVMDGTIDAQILENIKEGGDLLKRIINGEVPL